MQDMTNKHFLLSLLIFLSFFNSNAQNSYYNKGNKINLQLDTQNLNLIVKNDFNINSLSSYNVSTLPLGLLTCNYGEGDGKLIKVTFNTKLSNIDYIQKVNSIKNIINVIKVAKYFKKSETESIGTSNICYVKLKNVNDLSLLQTKATQKKFKVVRQNGFMPLWYQLEINKSTIEDTIELTNYLYETQLFAEIDPAFMFDFKTSGNIEPACANDEFFNDQWECKTK